MQEFKYISSITYVRLTHLLLYVHIYIQLKGCLCKSVTICTICEFRTVHMSYQICLNVKITKPTLIILRFLNFKSRLILNNMHKADRWNVFGLH